ncbi:hypothetical protein H6P81_006785 [Aristolochia fimbriata]|uniref:Acyl-coenzyme A thioesterase 13 n=1 Tax=Aristolochia fimbriata TaxID=158543 RepID=A0AAV7F109_ARIFI|nr:hypothetical protein H6P81_006785 [Aristolochia fimbriata]
MEVVEKGKARANAALALNKEDSRSVSELKIVPHRPAETPSFYEAFAQRGILVDQIRPGLLVCTFRVPSRLTDENGNFSNGAIANLVDEIGSAALLSEGFPIKVSVDMSISYLSPAKMNDELEIISKSLGHKGGYSGASVLLRNKATGEVIAEGRHSLFGKLASKI